jgi:rubrerythrin
MTADDLEARRLLCSASLGYTAYHVWAAQARRERRYNIARLLDASSNVKRVRAERAFRALGEVGKTPANIERALAGLEPASVATGPVTGTTALSRELMGRAGAALAEGRDLTAAELGDLYVCGTCGELMEGGPPATCAECGTVREGFLSFRAAEAMGTHGPYTIVKRLEQGPDTLRALVSDLSDEELSLPVAGRSLKELVGHLADIDVVFRERAWLILETESPRLPLGHPPTLARAVGYRTQPIADLLEAFTASRQQTLSLLRGLTAAAWHRTAYHEVFGVVPLTHQGNWVIEHEKGHLVEMAQIRHDLVQGRADQRPITLPPTLVPEILEGE